MIECIALLYDHLYVIRYDADRRNLIDYDVGRSMSSDVIFEDSHRSLTTLLVDFLIAKSASTNFTADDIILTNITMKSSISLSSLSGIKMYTIYTVRIAIQTSIGLLFFFVS